jgi:transposase InsO family protein
MRFTMPPSCILASPGKVADDEAERIHDFTCKVVILVFPFGSIECHHLDNLSAHKGERVRELIEHKGCELLYLPPYSPNLNPIEEAFSKVKGILRKAEARTREALVEVMGRALSAVNGHDARGFFDHCGYRPLAQLL